MTQYLNIHPQNPQERLIAKLVTTLNDNGIVALPTDSRYVLATTITNLEGLSRIRQIRRLDDNHLFSLICGDFSQISEFAMMDDRAFRLIKKIFPGAYTVILQGTKNLGKKLLSPKRKTVGIRMPRHKVLQTIINTLGAPLIATSLELPDENESIALGYEVYNLLENQIDAVVDCGESAVFESTVLDLTTEPFSLIRQGVAEVPW